ncbi:MAG: aminoglycoside phosphotransferase [Frankiales bacterium]|nr:aminoglycoside phosphotransferase [Frankiales bacterium]
MDSLAALVAAAPGSLVLPPGERRAVVAVPAPLRLLAALELDHGRAVGVVEDAAGARWTVPLAAEAGSVRRALPGDGVAEALLRRLSARVAGGPASADLGGSFTAQVWHAEPIAGESGLTVDQTNESVVVGERAMVKWSVRLPRAGERGAQPAADRIAALAAAGFTETPAAWALLRWTDADGVDVLLAAVTAYLPHAQDGWDWAVADVSAAARHRVPADDALAAPRRLGSLTARLHVALAHGRESHAGADLAQAWRAAALAELDEALTLVGGPEGDRLRARAPRIAAAYDALAAAAGTPLIPVHGDYHVGQVLRTPSDDPALRFDYAVTDFDGNPVLAAAQRGAPQPAALDVAGMLASLDHVGRVVLRRTEGADAEVVRGWIPAAQEEFGREYAAGLALAGHAHLLDERLVPPLRFQQEVREHLYAVRHLPHWGYVADGALVDLLPDVPTDRTPE